MDVGLLMMNPFDSSNAEETETEQSRASVWRKAVSAPFFLYGIGWCLLIVRTPERVGEALARISASGWSGVASDPVFAESLWRCTTLPLMGPGAMTIALGIIWRKWQLTVFGFAWTTSAFFIGYSVFH